MEYLNKLLKWKDILTQQSHIVAGKLYSIKGLRDNERLSIRKNDLIRNLFSKLNGESPDEILKLLYNDSDIISLISELIIVNQFLMGRQIDENDLPTALNSYYLIALSILFDDDVDLTYGTTNVTDNELAMYYKARKPRFDGGGKKYKTTRRRRSTRNTRYNRTKH